MSGRRRGDQSPDSGVDTQEWDGPRMSLEPYNYGNDNAWAKQNGAEPKKNGPYKGRPPNNMPNGAGPRRSPKNSPNLEQYRVPVPAASQFPARTNFLLEHLSSFTLKTFQDSQVPPQDRLKQTKELLAKGNQWTKEMEMRLTDTDVVLLDGETQDVVEVFSLSTIGHVHHFSDDPDLNSVLVFNTMQTEDRFAAMHLFQSDRVPAAVVATEIMKASSSRAAMPHKFAAKSGVMLPPPPTHPAPTPPKEVDQERLDLYEKSLVAQTIAAFSAAPESSAKKPAKPQVTSKYQASESSSDIPDESLSAEILEGRTNRDVQILNHCIDDIENLVLRTKKSAEAWKKLKKKKGKIKPESIVSLEARPPPEEDFYDAFQKIKHSFNLLGRLRHHIHNPNAAELVHYLFVPLSLLVRCTGGPEKARAVVVPLLTAQAIDLLQNCLSSREMEIWTVLGPNWNLTKSNVHFKDQFISPYTPVFKDGWVPPQVIAGKDVSNLNATIAANAAAVAQLNDEHRKGDDPSVASNLANPAVLAAAAKFRRLTSVKKPEETAPTSPTKKGLRRVRVLYDFQARNSKELSVQQGEEVAVLLDNRQWWCVRNTEGAIGFVPSTIVEDSVVLPSPPTTAPPPVPTTQVTSSQTVVPKTETTTVLSSAPAPVSAPAPAQAPSPTRAAGRAPKTSAAPPAQEGPQFPHVELRPVGMAKPNRPVSAPPASLVIPPPPPSKLPPVTPPPYSPPPALVITNNNGTAQKEKEATLPGGTDLARAIQEKNLKKVDHEAEKKRREQAQQNKLSSADMLNDELKRRMTSSQGKLTPTSQRKENQPAVHLTAESSAPEVKLWLKSKGFSGSCVTALSGKTAADLERMTKDQLKQVCGDSEGSRVFSQFTVLKGSWTVTRKGSELEFIMKKRKERATETGEKEPEISGELRAIVADAKLAAARVETEIIHGSGYREKKLTAPATKPRNKSFAKPETKPRSDSRTDRKLSHGVSFEKEFVPPPPVLESENQATRDEGSPIVSNISSEEVDKIVREQKKQQDLLLEHDKQLFLLEQLQRQKVELELQKREFEEQQKRHKQAALQDQQKELQRQIQEQQDQLKENQSKLNEQQRLLTGYDKVSPQITYAAVPQVVPQVPQVVPQVTQMLPQVPQVVPQVTQMMPQVPVMPIRSMPAAAPTYLPVGGVQPMYTPYTTTVASPGMAQLMPTYGVPTVSTTHPPV